MRWIIALLFLAISSNLALGQKPIVEVKVDKRIELLRIVWNLSVMKYLDEEMHPATSDYQQEVTAYFKKFNRHKAVKKIRKIWIGDYSFPTLGLELTDDFLIPDEPSARLKEWLDRYGEDDLKTVFSLIKQFSEDTDFNIFYAQHKQAYQLMVNPLQHHLDTSGLIIDVADFFGSNSPEKFEVFFDPLNNIGNTEVSTEERETPRIAVAFLGEVDEENKNVPVRFNIGEDTRRILYHELTHFYTSALTAAALETLRVKKDFFLSKDDKENDKEVPDIVWLNQIDETIVRGITAYLFKVLIEEAEGVREIGYQEGYSYADEVYQIMDNYFFHKKDYPKFSTFHPEIIALILSFE